MNTIQGNRNPFPIILVAIATFGMTVSVSGYGIFVYLLIVLILQSGIDLQKKLPQQIDTTDTWLYFYYAIIFFICTLFNGDGDIGRNSLIANYMVCILVFSVISREFKSKAAIDKMANVLWVMALLDCTVTIMQYHNNTLGWGIWYFFNDAKTVEQSGIIDSLDAGSQILGRNHLFCPGIFPSQVYNGYMVGALSAIALYKLQNAKTLLQRLTGMLSLLLIAYSLVVIQQRMAFFLFIFVFVAMMYSRSKLMTWLIAVGLLAVYLLYGIDVGENQLGRLVDLEDKTREHLYSNGIDYVFSHFWVGGRQEFMVQNSLSVHNIFLNAFMYGGILGAALIIAIYLRMCIASVKVIVKSFSDRITRPVGFAYALLIYNLISLTHNNSLLTGDPIIWVLYALMLLSLKYEKQQ